MASFNPRFRGCSPFFLIWIGAGVSNLVKDIQFYIFHNENHQHAGTYSQSCRSLEELEIQVTALFSQLRWRERDGFLSRLHPYVPVATRKELRASSLLGDHIFDEGLVSHARNRLQGDVSLKSNTIMLDTLVKCQGPKRPAPALPPSVSNKKPKQNPQPSGRGGDNKGKGHFSAKKGKGCGAKGAGRL